MANVAGWLAQVTRDRLMREAATEYPQYGAPSTRSRACVSIMLCYAHDARAAFPAAVPLRQASSSTRGTARRSTWR